MRYFQLLDDLNIPNRWHLGDITIRGVDLKVELDAGRLITGSPVDVEVSHDGRPLEFSFTAFGVPVVSEALGLEIEMLVENDLQRVPAQIFSAGGFDILNCFREIECLDEKRSNFDKWPLVSHRPDLAGEYRTVTKLRVNENAIPPNAHLFRVAHWRVALIVSETLKDVMLDVGCFGAKFLPA